MKPFSSKIFLQKWLQENWAAGQYIPTEEFKTITNHSCVCKRDETGLISLSGPAEDPESQALSDLIAAAPLMLEALIEARNVIRAQNKGDCLASVMEAIRKATGE